MQTQELLIPNGNYQIQADFYMPEPITKDSSIIIMAHGLGGEKSCGLNSFAEAYAELGYNLCVFDHSGFGLSSGPVQHLVDKNSQLQDWNVVIDYIQSRFYIPKKNIILWGYSFSGAHVLTLASEHTFKAVISNFPHVDGLASLTLYPKKYLLPATMIALQDLALAKIGRVKTMPVVAKDRFAILAGEDCYDAYYRLFPDGMNWKNAVPARIVATIGLYRPTMIVHKIQCPVFVSGAELDSLIPVKATRKLAQKLKQGEYREFVCGHFDLFHSPVFDQLITAHQHFLEKLK